MNSDQIQHLEPIESAIGIASELFDFVPEHSTLISLAYIPLNEIGNFYTRQETITATTVDGEIKLPCKTFEIHSVMACKQTSVLGDKEANDIYFNNPYPIIEYVNQNSYAPWENILDPEGKYLGYVQNGTYYDRERKPAGTAQASTMRHQHAVSGNLFSIPADYRVEGSCLKFWPANVYQNETGHVAGGVDELGILQAHNGRLLHGRLACDARHEIEVQVRFTSLIEDERGYPLIDEPTKTALAYYMNYTRQLKRYFKQEVGQEVAAQAEQLYKVKVAQARSRLVINENLKHKILNVLNSHNRHGYQPGHIPL